MKNKDELLKKLGALASKTDLYDQCDDEISDTDRVEARGEIFQKVWSEAVGMRESGELLKKGKQIRCPVTAIHGDYDPHPAEGVEKTLSSVVDYFRFILIEKCGHTPWLERQAKNEFYSVLRKELQC